MASRGEMLLDMVDSQDRPFGTTRRKGALKRGAGFRVVHILLFDESGDLILQEISKVHDRHPGYWGSSVAGHVKTGESYEEAAQRKLASELGLQDVSLSLVGKTSMIDGTSKKFIAVYWGQVSRSKLTPNPDDFEGMSFAPLPQVHAELTANVRLFTPTFRHVFRFAAPTLGGPV